MKKIFFENSKDYTNYISMEYIEKNILINGKMPHGLPDFSITFQGVYFSNYNSKNIDIYFFIVLNHLFNSHDKKDVEDLISHLNKNYDTDFQEINLLT